MASKKIPLSLLLRSGSYYKVVWVVRVVQKDPKDEDSELEKKAKGRIKFGFMVLKLLYLAKNLAFTTSQKNLH